jgi:hypothetical protein
VLLLARHEALSEDPARAHGDEGLKDLEALPQGILIRIEEDPKYRKKYSSLWRK